MAAEKCMSSSFQPDTSMPGGHWGSSTDYLMALETDALARALGASINPNPSLDSTPSSSSMSSTFFPCSPSPTGSTSTFTVTTPGSSAPSSPFLHSRPSSAPASRSITRPYARPQPGAVAARRISKRKPRSPSKRKQIAYIETDPANFLEMVQQMTGFGKPPLPVLPRDQPVMPMMMMMMQRNETQQYLLPQQPMPTFDTSAGFIVDTLPVNPPQHQYQQILSGSGLLDNSLSYYLSELDELLSSTTTFPEIPQQQAQPLPPCFPTFESWSC